MDDRAVVSALCRSIPNNLHSNSASLSRRGSSEVVASGCSQLEIYSGSVNLIQLLCGAIGSRLGGEAHLRGYGEISGKEEEGRRRGEEGAYWLI